MEDRILLSQDEGVAHVRLNRPDKRNGLDHAMFEAIVRAGESLRHAPGLRAVVLSGEGSVFCAGLDFKAFISMGPDAIPKLLKREPGEVANLAQKVAWVWRELPVPVIAALHGVAYGGGLQIALGADLRYAAPETKLSVMEIRYGIIPDMGASKTLLPLVRDDIARELVYTGRVFGAEEAKGHGLVTEIATDPLARAMEVAKTIAANNPEGIRAAKALFAHAPALSDADALKLESDLQIPLLGSANQLEAVQAAMMKRPPKFTDPDPT